MDGSVVVVTGASSGLGRETAKQILIRATPRMLIDSHMMSYSPELGGSNGEETKAPLLRVVEATCQELHLESV
jgi:NAD(P)-dependent dehydrogenase (short-subunit alcohol dehydrogenase family)